MNRLLMASSRRALVARAAMAAAAVLAPLAASAQGAAPSASAASAPVSAAKKALVAKILKLQQPGIEQMGRTLAEQPAQALVGQARQAMARVPEGQREALGRDLDGEVRKYLDEAVPIVRDRAVALAPSTIGPILEQRFTDEELRQVVAILESPVNAKFQSLAGDMQRALGTRLVGETRAAIEPKAKALEQAVVNRLRAAIPAASAPGN